MGGRIANGVLRGTPGGRFRMCIAVAVSLVVPPVLKGATPLTTVRVASGLEQPVYVTYAPGDFERVFIVEQVGRIRVLKNGELLDTAFLDVTTLNSYGGEQGLLGLAFHPDYAHNGYFYINYTNTAGNTVVARYTGNGDEADATTARIVLTISQPFANHNGGWLSFSPRDGYLYIAMGDGGDSYDPGNRAQNTDVLLGKMLRININADGFPNDDTRNYAIPGSNPFVGVAGADEIWAYGLRNPWRPAFDRATGDLYIADVGQYNWEEIDFQPASSLGGENYGWRCMEGGACTGRSGCTCNDPALTPPLYTYSHGSPYFGCAVMGGEVYRGSSIPDLVGTYFFADHCSNDIFSFLGGESLTDFQDRTGELAPCHDAVPPGFTLQDISSFGQDAFGVIYVCDLYGGEVFKIIADEPLEIVGGDPPNDSIDARAPQTINNVEYSFWASAILIFNEAAGCVTAADFVASKQGGQVASPLVGGISIGVANPHRVTVNLSSPIEARSWVTIGHLPSQTSLRVGALPGDVDGSGISSPTDILALVDALNQPVASAGTWSVDIDHSGTGDSADVLAEISLLNGVGVAMPYLGASLP